MRARARARARVDPRAIAPGPRLVRPSVRPTRGFLFGFINFLTAGLAPISCTMHDATSRGNAFIGRLSESLRDIYERARSFIVSEQYKTIS